MKNFLNDKDGLSMKDYLMILSTTVFFAFVTIGLIMALLHREIDQMYLELLGTVSPVVMTIVGGVFGVTAVETFRRKDEVKDGLEEETWK